MASDYKDLLFEKNKNSICLIVFYLLYFFNPSLLQYMKYNNLISTQCMTLRFSALVYLVVNLPEREFIIA